MSNYNILYCTMLYYTVLYYNRLDTYVLLLARGRAST